MRTLKLASFSSGTFYTSVGTCWTDVAARRSPLTGIPGAYHRNSGPDYRTLQTKSIHKGRAKWPIFCRRYFPMHFLNENCDALIQISLIFVRSGPLSNRPALVQIMAWRRTSDKPLSEPMRAEFTDACIYASIGLDELKNEIWDEPNWFNFQSIGTSKYYM